MDKFEIIKRTATTMHGETEVLGVVGIFDSWTAATCVAQDLESADRGKLHNGRKIMYDVKLAA